MKNITGCFIFIIAFFLLTSTGAATMCAYTELPKEEMKKADLVFKGELSSFENSNLKFEIDYVWVGDVDEETIFLTESFLSEPKIGEEYIIFAESRSGSLSPMSCGNTGVASEELEFILNDEPVSQTTMMLMGVTSVGGLIAILSFLIFRFRKNK